jgi:hypothetical protein
MLKSNQKQKHYTTGARLLAVGAVIMVLTEASAAAQTSPLASSLAAPGTLTFPAGAFGGKASLGAAIAVGLHWKGNALTTGELNGDDASGVGNEVRSDGTRRITLEQVKQSVDPPVTSPFVRLGQLSIEAAKQHRLGVQADYFPKFGATFANLHSTDRPILDNSRTA